MRPYRGRRVTYLDSPRGRSLLPSAEGLSVLAYAALHGQNQRDLSSCQISSLLSVVFKKGTRARVGKKAPGAWRAARRLLADRRQNCRPP